MTAGRTNHTKFAAAGGAFVTDVDGKRHWWAKGEPFPDCKLLGDDETIEWRMIQAAERQHFNMPKEWQTPGAFGGQESRVLYADEPISEQSYTPMASRGTAVAIAMIFGEKLR